MASSRGFGAGEERFYTAMIEKENRQRLAWFTKHGGHLIQQQEQQLSDNAEEEKHVKINRQGIRSARKLQPVGSETNSEQKTEVLAAVMRPVPAEVRKLIYTGTSKTGEGRIKYLNERYKKAPKEKFYFAECKNWEYGWGVAGSNVVGLDSSEEPKHGRVAVILESFYRRSGVERDPPHYREPVNMNAPFTVHILPF